MTKTASVTLALLLLAWIAPSQANQSLPDEPLTQAREDYQTAYRLTANAYRHARADAFSLWIDSLQEMAA